MVFLEMQYFLIKFIFLVFFFLSLFMSSHEIFA